MRIALLFLISLGGLLSSEATVAEPRPAEAWYKAAVDHVDTAINVLVYRDPRGRFLVRDIDLDQLGLATAGKPQYRHAGEWYYRADELPEHEVHVDTISRRVNFVRRWRTHIDPPASPDLLLDVILNGRKLDQPLLLHFAGGEIVLSEAALEALEVDEAQAKLLLREEDHVPLHALAGENFAVDYTALQLHMTVPPTLINPVRVSVSPRASRPVTPDRSFSTMLGYEINTGVDAARQRWESGRFDLAASTGSATCHSQHIRLPEVEDFRRLDSRCIVDWPGRLLSLNVGDAITRSGALGQSVRYGGIRFGSDYGLAPALLTQPSLLLLGTARVPSTLEVWVDQMLALRQEVAPGVFEISDIPAHSGSGEIRAIIYGPLGTREVIRESFYSDTALLASGLVDWAVEAGRVREAYGLESDHYGERFGLINVRYGLTDWLTVAPRVEATESFTVAGGGIAARVGTVGVIELATAASRVADGPQGTAREIGFSRRGRYVSFNVRHATSDEGFVEMGYPVPGSMPAESSRVNVGISLPGGASLSVGGFRRILHDDTPQRFHTAALSIPVGRFAYLLFSALDSIEPANERLYSMHLTIPFGGQSSVSANAFRRGDSQGRQLALQRNLSSGRGVGYRVATSDNDGTRVHDASLLAQNDVARFRLDAHHVNDITSGVAGISGSVIASPSGVFLSRGQADSAAIVELPAANVRVYHDERLAAVTNANGKAIVPGLRPYEVNRLRVEVDDLPLTADIRSTELRVTPGRRHAVPVEFTIAAAPRHLSGRLLLAGKRKPVPSGAAITMRGSTETFPVGYDGFFYLATAVENALNLEVTWPGGSCRADIRPGTSSEAFIELGDVQCEE